MPRKANFPPRKHVRNGYERTFWNGDWHHLGPAGSKEAADRYKSLLAVWASDAPPPPKTDTLPLAAVCSQYLVEQRRDRAGKRELERIEAAVVVLSRLFGAMPASEFKIGHLEEVRRQLASGDWMKVREKWERARHKQPVGHCRNQTNLQIRRIRSLFRWAERKGFVPEGRWAHLRTLPCLGPTSPLARDTEPRQPSKLEDVQKVAALCPPAVGTMILLQWYAGTRSEEIRIMRTMDLDTSGEVWVYRPGSDQRFGKHKNAWRGHTREIYFGKECQELLMSWLKLDRPGEYLFAPEGKNVKHDHYTKDAYCHAVNRAASKAGLKGLQPYQGRHAAKRRVTRGMNLDAARAFLGQRSLDTTNGYDRHIDAETAQEAARKFA